MRTEVFTASDSEAAIRVIPDRRRRGRPSTGVRVDIRIPADILEWIDTFAEVNDITRAEALREAVACFANSYANPSAHR